MIVNIIIIGILGFIGANIRYFITKKTNLLVVNIIGIALLFFIDNKLIILGLIGSITTYSGFIKEIYENNNKIKYTFIHFSIYILLYLIINITN